MKWVAKIVGALALTVLTFVGGYSVRDLWASRPIDLSGLVGQKKSLSPTELFQREYDHIYSSASVGVSKDKLKYSGMAGMFAALGDPHTNFMEPVDADSFKLQTRGNFVGIGARLAEDPAGAKVAVVYKGTPADKAGIKVNDTIVEVNGKDTNGIGTDAIVKMIRGEENTPVRIKVLRAGSKSPLSFRIIRAVVELPSATGKYLAADRVGYVSVTEFAQPTVAQFDQALTDIMSKDPEGLVIDLRTNPGGLLETAVEMLARFVENQVVVQQRKRGGDVIKTYTPFGKVKRIDVPIVVLVNSESASASEIFAGVLQEYKKATILGEHTYGKSSVQTVKNLIDLSSAKITIAKYFLPSGRDIGRKLDEDGEYVSGGIKPDIEFLPDPMEEVVLGEPERDSVLHKAIETIKSKARR